MRTEVHHQAAKQFFQKYQSTQWIVLSTIFDETVTWYRAKVSISASIEVGHALRSEHRYISLSSEDDDATWNAFCRYDDKAWSYTDCSLLGMAQRLNTFTVVSFDEHIRQMAGLGVICVP